MDSVNSWSRNSNMGFYFCILNLQKIMKRLGILRGAGNREKVKFAPVAEQADALDLKSKEV